MKRTLAERFWRHVQRGAPNECWPWIASRTRGGYGQLGLEKKTVRAHQVAYFLTHGAWPLVARHTCDFRPCCNPKHILNGTQRDNMRDMAERGRCVDHRGVCNPRARLSAADVVQIRAAAHSPEELASRFNVSARHIRKIRNGARWRAIAESQHA